MRISPVVRGRLALDDRDPEQREMFEKLAALYHGRGVVTAAGFAPALVDTCPNRKACWAGCEHRASGKDVKELPGEDGSIFFPWIGMDYRHGGVCLVGWNLNHWGQGLVPADRGARDLDGKPRALIVFGGVARDAVLSVIRKDGDARHWSHETRGGYGRRQSVTPWGALDLFSLWHPSYARWPEAHKALVADLVAHPLDPHPSQP